MSYSIILLFSPYLLISCSSTVIPWKMNHLIQQIKYNLLISTSLCSQALLQQHSEAPGDLLLPLGYLGTITCMLGALNFDS